MKAYKLRKQNAQLPFNHCGAHFQGNRSGSVMTNLRPSVLIVAPELASTITSVGIPVTLYLFPSFSYTITQQIQNRWYTNVAWRASELQ